MTIRNRQRGGEPSSRRLPTAGGGRSRTRRLVAALAAVAALGAFWLFLAPVELGGSTDYVATYGISMEPRFHTGDLAIVRAHSTYQVGQVVAYDNLELGRVVLHRIIGRIGDRYVFKGDNNNFIDPFHPTRSELIGELWVRVPRGGLVLSWVRAPGHAAVVSGLAVVFVLLLGGGSASRRRRRTAPRTPSAGPSRALAADWAQPLLGAALVAALGCGLLAAVSYHRSTTRTLETPGYVQQGAYAYSARVSRSAVYPSGRLAAGQTVFTRLAHRVQVGFSYRFLSALPHTVHGDAQLRLALSSSLGWSMPLPSPAGRAFTGDTVQLSQALDIPAIEAVLSHYLASTGITSDSFTLTMTPSVNVQGTVSGQSVKSAFAPTPLTFIVDQDTLRLMQAPSGGGIPGQPAADPLHPSAAGTVVRTVPRTIRILGRTAFVTTVRKIAGLGLLAALVFALLALVAAQAGWRLDEATRLRRRYHELIVSLPVPPASPDGGFVDVASFDDLVRIAASSESLVLSSCAFGSDSFYVAENGIVYRYTINAPAADASWSARVLACSRALSQIES